MIKTDRYKSKFNNLGETRDQVCNKLGEFAERTFSGIEAAVVAFQEHNYQPNNGGGQLQEAENGPQFYDRERHTGLAPEKLRNARQLEELAWNCLEQGDLESARHYRQEANGVFNAAVEHC